jgi:hypothetical protein
MEFLKSFIILLGFFYFGRRNTNTYLPGGAYSDDGLTFYEKTAGATSLPTRERRSDT